MRDKTRDLLPLVCGAHEEHDYEDRTVPTLSWHVCQWGEERIELVGLPDTYEDSVVAIGYSKNAAKTLKALARSLEEYCNRPEERVLVYASGKWRPDAEIGKVSWEDIVLPDEHKVEIRTAVENFFSQREVYRSLDFAWRRGVLLVGPLGTGKTMVCKAAAAALTGLPFLYVRDLSSSHAQEKRLIASVFSRARELSPCVLVFEDIDGFVNNHNRAVFLGELDGFKNNDGMLVLASSNHPERVDEALLKRPSRFDRVFKIGPPAAPERERYCLKLLESLKFLDGDSFSGELDVRGLAAEVARRSNGFTPGPSQGGSFGRRPGAGPRRYRTGYRGYKEQIRPGRTGASGEAQEVRHGGQRSQQAG